MEESVTIETMDKCECEARICILEQKLSSIVRKMIILICASCVLCLITLAACGGCIFLYTDILRLRKGIEPVPGVQIDTGKEAEGDGGYYYEYQTAADDYSYTDEGNDTFVEIQVEPADREKRKDVEDSDKKSKVRKDKPVGKNKGVRHARGNRCPKCCKRMASQLNKLQKKVNRMKRNIDSLTLVSQVQTTLSTTKQPSPRTQQGLTQTRNSISHVAAAHYTSYVTNEYIQTQFKPPDDGNLQNIVMCVDKPEWHGKLCRNRTFVTSGAPITLNMFKEAGWMKNVSSQQVFDMRADGVFVARHTGIYLVYAHVLFYDSLTRQAIELVHEGVAKDESAFRCIENKDYVTPQPGFGQDSRYISCSAQYRQQPNRTGIAVEHRSNTGFEVRSNLMCLPNKEKDHVFYPCDIVGMLYIQKGEQLRVQTFDRMLILDEDKLYFGSVLVYSLD